jgi:L-threonylcarbamoyladenylate synthase
MKTIETGNRLNKKYIISECISFFKQNQDGTILLPTESTYGLICRWDSEAAKIKIRQLKKRFKNTTFQLYAVDTEMVIKAGYRLSKGARKLADSIPPGNLTIVDTIEDEKIAFKITNNEIMEPLIDEMDTPLAVTSTGKPTRTLNDALAQFIGKPDLAIDAGVIVKNDSVSTVLELNGTKCKLLRPGVVSENQIKEALTSGS